MRHPIVALVSPALVLLWVATTAFASDGNAHEVVIGAAALAPPVVNLALHERVVFVNRSGRAVHVEFSGPEGEHHVVQMPGTLWAEFHWPGEHAYAVHFGGSPPDLHGVVNVDYGPPFIPGPECGGFTIEEVCIER
jgi:hypothetical protein